MSRKRSNIKRSLFSHRRSLSSESVHVFEDAENYNDIQRVIHHTLNVTKDINEQSCLVEKNRDSLNRSFMKQVNELDPSNFNKSDVDKSDQFQLSIRDDNEENSLNRLLNQDKNLEFPGSMPTTNIEEGNGRKNVEYLLNYLYHLKTQSMQNLQFMEVTLKKRRKVLHMSERPSPTSWRKYYLEREGIVENIQKQYSEQQLDTQMKIKDLQVLLQNYEVRLLEKNNELEMVSKEKKSMELRISELEAQLHQFTSKLHDSKDSQCSIISSDEYHSISKRLSEYENKVMFSKETETIIESNHAETNTPIIELLETGSQCKPSVKNVASSSVVKMASKISQGCPMEHSEKSIDAQVESVHQDIDCRILDPIKIEEIELSLRNQLYNLTNIEKIDKDTNCEIVHELQLNQLKYNSKAIQNTQENIDEMVECIPESMDFEHQTIFESQDIGVQSQASVSHIGLSIKPKAKDFLSQFISSNIDFSAQHLPDTHCVSANTIMEVQEKGTVCIIFSEEVGCQCNILTIHQELSQDFSMHEDSRLSSEKKKKKRRDKTPKHGKGTKRKAELKYCDLCNIQFGSPEELQLHQEACHTKRRKVDEDDHETQECDICMLELFDGKPMYRLRTCRHYFHIHCIYRCLLSRSIPNRCVRCFTDITDLEKERIMKLVRKTETKSDTEDNFRIYEFE